MELRDRWFASVWTALRDRSVNAAEDAGDAVGSELGWTYLMIVAGLVGLLAAIGGVNVALGR